MSSTDADRASTARVPTRALAVFAVSALAAVQAGGSAPTPLYRLYQDSLGFSSTTLTVIFAAYPLGILLALLTVGPLSDFVGRRPVAAGALLLSAAAMAGFLQARDAWQLIEARSVQGFATGAAASTLGAMILDVHVGRGALVNSVTAFTGTTIGAVGSSALVAYAPAPSQLVFALLLAGFVGLALAVVWLPESRERSRGAWASLRPRAVVPPQVRTSFVLVTPANVAGWALGGFYLSLMPSLLHVATGTTSPFTGGAIAAALTLSGSAAILVSRDWPAARTLSAGAWLLAVGVAITLVGVRQQSSAILVVGTLVAGLGFGACFFGAARTILPLARNDERAGLISAFYVESYLAFSLPAVAAGSAASRVGLTTTTYVYGAVVIVLAGASLLSGREAARRRTGGVRG